MILSDKMDVVLLDSMGDDRSVIRAARVSVADIDPAKDYENEALLRFLMRNRHASPFDHVNATFLVDVPIFVSREWVRHRTLNFNETSGRYRVLEPKFYMPGEDRPICQMGKPGAYRFSHGVKEQWQQLRFSLDLVYDQAWVSYQTMLEAGIAKEVARMCLPVGIYTQLVISGTLRNWLNFLSLRTADDALFEIRDAAAQIETHLHRVAPVSVALWDEYGRGAL